MAIFRRGPHNWGKNRDFPPISGFGIDHCWIVACRQHFDGGAQVIARMRRPSPAINKRRRATHQRILTESFDVMPKTKEQHLIIRMGKSETEVTTNTRSSAVAERPRDASCLSVVSLNITIHRTQSFISYFGFRFINA